jgi:hypothetical protein
MCKTVINLLIGGGGVLVAVSTLMNSFGVFLLSGEKELKRIQELMDENKSQADAQKIVTDRNTLIKNIYAAIIFLGAIAMAVGGLYK